MGKQEYKYAYVRSTKDGSILKVKGQKLLQIKPFPRRKKYTRDFIQSEIDKRLEALREEKVNRFMLITLRYDSGIYRSGFKTDILTREADIPWVLYKSDEAEYNEDTREFNKYKPEFYLDYRIYIAKYPHENYKQRKSNFKSQKPKYRGGAIAEDDTDIIYEDFFFEEKWKNNVK